MSAPVRARVVGPDAEALAAVLETAGVDPSGEAGAVVHVTLTAAGVDGLEDALTAWVDAARDAAAFGGDVVTVVGEGLLDGDDAGALALGHGLVSATRAYAMERERSGEVGNVVVARLDALDRAASAVLWLLRDRVLSGEVVQAGTPRHGRQRP